MKTPRELLLSQHRNAEPKLDAIRATVLKEVNHEERKERSWNLIAWFLGCSQAVWRELIFPARPIWAGFAVVWLAILVINVAISDRTEVPAAQAKGKTASENAFAAWREQQRILAELNGVSESTDADRPKPFVPKPHSERIKLQSLV